MPDYSKSKIYTIRCQSDDSLIYVGATIQPLSVRLGEHKRSQCTSINKYINNPENNTTWDDWYIELFEVFPCECKMELCKREGEIIREIATINRIGYYVDRKEYKKEYDQQNKEVISAYKKEYHERNKDVRLAYKKEQYEQNKDVVLAKKKEYYEQNKDTILAKQKEYRERKKK
jgi:hypothetical protein